MLTVLLVAGLGAVRAQTPPPAELFFKRPAVLEAELSPSGRRLAITTAARGGDRVGVYVFDLQADPPTAHAAAVFRDADVPSIDWLDDERLLFSLVDLQAAGGEDYRVGRGLYTVRHDGRELRQLIERHGRSMVRDGSQPLKTLPWNHRLLHVPRLSEGERKEIIVGERVVDGNDLVEVRPLWLDPRTGRTRTMNLRQLPPGVQAWWFSPQGEIRAVLSRRDGQERLYWHRPDADDAAQRWQLLAEAPLAKLPFLPAWVGPGEQLYVSHHQGLRGERVISAFDFGTGKPAAQALVSVPGFDFRGRLISEADRLQGVRVESDAEQTIWFDPSRKALQAIADEALPGRVNRISCSRCEADDAVMLVRSYSDRQPGQLWLYRQGQAQPWQPINAVQPGVDAKQMASVELHRIKARDGLELPVWVTTPAGDAKGPRPAVVLVHGGPWLRGGHWRWQDMQQFLASRGYLVIEPEFRGSDGYGLRHLRAGFRQWGQAMQDDVADALRWAQQQGLASDKACIAGGSYGGYSTLMGLIRDPALYRCGIAWVAVTDPFLLLEGSWWVRDDTSEASRRYRLPEMIGDAERDKAMLLAHSPVEQAAHIKAPLLLAFGSDDRRVPLAHGNRLRDAMRKAGQEPEWVVYEGEAHGWRLERNQVDFARRVEAFLGKHLPVQ